VTLANEHRTGEERQHDARIVRMCSASIAATGNGQRSRAAEAGSLSPTLCLDLAHEVREIRPECGGDAVHVE